MLILVLLGMYFDAVVVFVTSQTLLFRLALAILCPPKVPKKVRKPKNKKLKCHNAKGSKNSTASNSFREPTSLAQEAKLDFHVLRP